MQALPTFDFESHLFLELFPLFNLPLSHLVIDSIGFPQDPHLYLTPLSKFGKTSPEF